MHAKTLTLLAAAAAVGCAAQPQYFQPTEKVTAQSPSGAPAASYKVGEQAGQQLAEVNVWSQGAFRGTVSGVKSTIVHVGLQVKNTSGETLIFDPSKATIQSTLDDGRPLQNPQLVSVSPNDMTVPPQSMKEFDLYFAEPHSIKPHKLDAFNVRWAVRTKGGREFVQFTPFTEQPDYYWGNWGYPYYGYAGYAGYWGYPFAPAYGYYDPYLYGPWWGPPYPPNKLPVGTASVRPSHHWYYSWY